MQPSARWVGIAVVAVSLITAWSLFRKPPGSHPPLPADDNPVALRGEAAAPAAPGSELVDGGTTGIRLLGEIEPVDNSPADPWQVAPLPAAESGWSAIKQDDWPALAAAHGGNAPGIAAPELPSAYPATDLPAFAAPPRRQLDLEADVFQPPVGALAPTPLPARANSPRVHRVRDGDTLSSLALHYLGNAMRFRELYEANRDRLSSPDVLPIGTLLRIPDERDLAHAR